MNSNQEGGIVLTCPNCHQRISAGSEILGLTIECPVCSQQFLAQLQPVEGTIQLSEKRQTISNNFKFWKPLAATTVIIAVLATLFLGFKVVSRLSTSGDPSQYDTEQIHREVYSGDGSVIQPLSELANNRLWQEFVKSPSKTIHVINQGELRLVLGAKPFEHLYPNKPTRELASFHDSLFFCLNYGDHTRDRNAEQWAERLEKFDIFDMDEFDRRDFIESEKKAAEEILSVFPEGTKYTIVSNWMFAIADFDFEYQAYKLRFGSDEFIESFGGWRPWEEKLFMKREHAQMLREEGADYISIRWESDLEWPSLYFSKEGARISLDKIYSKRFISPDDWSLDAVRVKGVTLGSGDLLLVLHPGSVESGGRTRDFQLFASMLDKYHKKYMEVVYLYCKRLLTYNSISALDADTFRKELELRDDTAKFKGVSDLRDAQKRLSYQLAILDPDKELDKLIRDYLTNTSLGLQYMEAPPIKALEILGLVLKSQGSLPDDYRVISNRLRKEE